MKGYIAHLNLQSIVFIKGIDIGYLELVDRGVITKKSLSLSCLDIKSRSKLRKRWWIINGERFIQCTSRIHASVISTNRKKSR